MFDVKKYFNDLRKNKHKYDIYRNKFIKKKVREYQRNHNGKHPNLKLIPSGLYCYNSNGSCPFYETCKSVNGIGLVAVGQDYIGKCNFLNMTDDDMNGWGLLWDKVKECSVNMEEK